MLRLEPLLPSPFQRVERLWVLFEVLLVLMCVVVVVIVVVVKVVEEIVVAKIQKK